jgi:mono/diheme cytochrome c family protein
MTKPMTGVLVLCGIWGCGGSSEPSNTTEPASTREPAPTASGDEVSPPDGKAIFRHSTFGDEEKWTDQLRFHEVIPSAVDPKTALKVGLKVDSEALPPGILDKADLSSPATTVALIKLGAVVGIEGKVDGNDKLVSVGVTCALCHSTVDDSVAPGIGKRLDGWPNRDLDVGAIIALSPAVPEAEKKVLRSWGKGRYDPRRSIDKANGPVLIPPAYGLKGVAAETYTGDGPVSYWNAYVAITQMGGKGKFDDKRIHVTLDATPDLVTPLLPALRDYQLSIAAPTPPAGSFDASAAQRGRVVFDSACASCHAGSQYTDSPKLHAPEETGMNPAYAARSATTRYRATPLRGLWQHAPYFHDGSAATLAEVVKHYDRRLSLKLTSAQKKDLVEFLKSL